MRKFVNNKNKEKFIQLYKKGLGTVKIANKLKLSRSTVTERLNKLNMK